MPTKIFFFFFLVERQLSTIEFFGDLAMETFQLTQILSIQVFISWAF